MQRLAILWNADVTLVNLTGQWTAMNLVGPRAREVLAKLTDIDLSPESFPYPAVREAVVAGVQALLLRVGFVGEVGYEIHVAAPYGMHIWRMLAGADARLRPFGVEAQRLLRLEKGHLIVGTDTDALTNPYEVGHQWAIADEKPFFVGQRSLAIVRKQPLSRRLAGIALAVDYSGPLPEECHLIIEEGQIAGRVTSFAPRSTLGRAIGLAFLRPDLAQPGTAIGIRVSNGRMVPAEVTRLPFYDPQGNRQA